MKHVLSPSELVLNPDGSIYHIALLPSQISGTVVTVGDQNRVAMVSKYFDKIDFELEKREFRSCGGWFKGQFITVISTGIGTDNIDIVVNEIDALVNIDLKTRTIKSEKRSLRFIRIGTSGSTQADIDVDSFVASYYGLGFDGLMQNYAYNNTAEEISLLRAINSKNTGNHYPVNPYLFACSKVLMEQFGQHMHSGITLTAPGFYGPQSRQVRAPLRNKDFIDGLLKSSYLGHDITNIEMETSGLYGLAKLLGHQALSLNVILANRQKGTFSKNPYESVDLMIKQFFDLL